MSMTTNLYEGHIEKDAREFLDKQVSLGVSGSVCGETQSSLLPANSEPTCVGRLHTGAGVWMSV